MAMLKGTLVFTLGLDVNGARAKMLAVDRLALPYDAEFAPSSIASSLEKRANEAQNRCRNWLG